jgi:hypothetical protein
MPRQASVKSVVIDDQKIQPIIEPLVEEKREEKELPIINSDIIAKDSDSLLVKNIKKEDNKIKKLGTKDDVFYGKALKTKGGLVPNDLMKNDKGLIVSKKRHEIGKKRMQNLQESRKIVKQ